MYMSVGLLGTRSVALAIDRTVATVQLGTPSMAGPLAMVICEKRDTALV
jgi:hypothetical protein